jgi:hypothetical protein
MKIKHFLPISTLLIVLLGACKKEVINTKTIVTGTITNAKTGEPLDKDFYLSGYKTTEGLILKSFLGEKFNLREFKNFRSKFGFYRVEFDAQADTTYIFTPGFEYDFIFPDSIFNNKIKSGETQVIDLRACPTANFQIKFVQKEQLTSADSLGIEFRIVKPCENVVSNFDFSKQSTKFYRNSSGSPINYVYFTESGKDASIKLTRFKNGVPISVVEKTITPVIGKNSPQTDFEF